MDVIRLLLYLTAAICFALAAFGVGGRLNVLAWVMIGLLDAVQAVD